MSTRTLSLIFGVCWAIVGIAEIAIHQFAIGGVQLAISSLWFGLFGVQRRGP